MSWLTGGSTNTQTTKDFTPEAYKKLIGGFASQISKLLGIQGGGGNSLMSGIPNYGGQTTAGMTGNENSLLQQLMKMQGGGGGAGNKLLQDTLAGRFLPGKQGANPFLDAAIRSAQRPTLEGLTETLTRAIPGRFLQAGQFGQPGGSSAFDRASAIATRGATQSMADIATQMSSGAYESERGRQQEAIGLSQQQVQMTIANLQAQALPRLIQQHGIDQGMALFNARLDALLKAFGITSGVAVPTLASNSSGSSTGGLANLFGSIFPKGI